MARADDGAHFPTSPPAIPIADVVARLLGADLDVGATAELALDMVVRATGAERGFLILGSDGRSFGSAGGPERPPEVSRGILEEVQRTRRPVVVGDAGSDPRFAGRDSIVELGARSVLCVPVLAPADGGVMGAIYLDAARAPGVFSVRERELAEALAASVAPVLRNAHRFEAQGIELARMRRAVAQGERGDDERPRLLGRSRAMLELEKSIARIAPGNHNVLILGESGTGKELVARSIHARSERARGPFVAENVGALAAGVVEAELFGHAKGAFTGADEARPGLFQLAQGGTLLLDEVGEMSGDLQKKLLRVLQEREVRPVGASSPIPIDVRVVAATHRDLQAMVRAGQFREDLFYRLNVAVLRVPSLRERPEDVPLLLEHFVAREAGAQKKPPLELPPDLVEKLQAHRWPGNVRELEAYATRFVIEGPGAAIESAATPETGRLGIDLRLPPGSQVSLREGRELFDRALVALVLGRCSGNVSAAARVLGMDRSYVSVLVKRFGLKKESP